MVKRWRSSNVRKTHQAPDIVRRRALGPVFRDGAGIVTLGQPLAAVIPDQAVVVVDGRGQVQQLALETEDGITLLSGLSQGELLIVFANVVEGFNVAQLMEVASRF